MLSFVYVATCFIDIAIDIDISLRAARICFTFVLSRFHLFAELPFFSFSNSHTANSSGFNTQRPYKYTVNVLACCCSITQSRLFNVLSFPIGIELFCHASEHSMSGLLWTVGASPRCLSTSHHRKPITPHRRQSPNTQTLDRWISPPLPGRATSSRHMSFCRHFYWIYL